jgi:SAM-dependent methyltransferase
MSERDWDAHYAEDNLPWDSDEPDPALVATAEAGGIPTAGHALEIGCGTGTNAVWLAARGLDVLGVDVSPRAVERARARAGATAGANFAVLDFLVDDPPGGPFDLVFDRGCFHVFDEPEARARFAARVAGLLVIGGRWLSLIGSTEGPSRDTGPPRRSAADIVGAVEPALEIVELRSIRFDVDLETPPAAWLCLSRRREIPAQPSTGS